MARKTPEETAEEISQLRNPLAELFQALQRSRRYNVIAGEVQLEVFFDGHKVGGLNRRESHFYISRKFVDEFGTSALLTNLGFDWKRHNETHQYWKLVGIEEHQKFRHVIEMMTDVPILQT